MGAFGTLQDVDVDVQTGALFSLLDAKDGKRGSLVDRGKVTLVELGSKKKRVVARGEKLDPMSHYAVMHMPEAQERAYWQSYVAVAAQCPKTPACEQCEKEHDACLKATQNFVPQCLKDMKDFAVSQCLQQRSIDGHPFWPRTTMEPVKYCLYIRPGTFPVGTIIYNIMNACPSDYTIPLVRMELSDPCDCVQEWQRGVSSAQGGGSFPNPWGEGFVNVEFKASTGLNQACRDTVPGLVAKCSSDFSTCLSDHECH